MHKENRGGGGGGIITVVIHLGAAKFLKERSITSLSEYADVITRIVQRQILGSFIRPKHWRFPLKNDGKEVIITDKFFLV
jgi:hypothetical protein